VPQPADPVDREAGDRGRRRVRGGAGGLARRPVDGRARRRGKGAAARPGDVRKAQRKRAGRAFDEIPARLTDALEHVRPDADEVHAVTLAHRDPAEPEAAREPVARRHLGDQPVPRDDRLVRVPGVVVPDGVGGEREGGGDPGGRRGQRERP
jgi:hypothetical protein